MTHMEEPTKRPQNDADALRHTSHKRPLTPSEYDAGPGLDADVLTWLSVEDEAARAELSKLLEAGIEWPPAATFRNSSPSAESEECDGCEKAAAEVSKFLETEALRFLPPVKFADDPYSSLLTYQTASSYITINGNEESCGSSFSDSGSSVMASLYVGGAGGAVIGWFKERAGGGAWDADVEEEARGWVLDDGEGCLAEEEGKEGAMEYEGCNFGSDSDDVMLAQFMGEHYLNFLSQ